MADVGRALIWVSVSGSLSLCWLRDTTRVQTPNAPWRKHFIFFVCFVLFLLGLFGLFLFVGSCVCVCARSRELFDRLSFTETSPIYLLLLLCPPTGSFQPCRCRLLRDSRGTAVAHAPGRRDVRSRWRCRQLVPRASTATAAALQSRSGKKI